MLGISITYSCRENLQNNSMSWKLQTFYQRCIDITAVITRETPISARLNATLMFCVCKVLLPNYEWSSHIHSVKTTILKISILGLKFGWLFINTQKYRTKCYSKTCVIKCWKLIRQGHQHYLDLLSLHNHYQTLCILFWDHLRTTASSSGVSMPV